MSYRLRSVDGLETRVGWSCDPMPEVIVTETMVDTGRGADGCPEVIVVTRRYERTLEQAGLYVERVGRP